MSALGAVLGKRTWLGAGAILLAAAGGCALGALLVVKGVLPEGGALAWGCGCWALAAFAGGRVAVWGRGEGTLTAALTAGAAAYLLAWLAGAAIGDPTFRTGGLYLTAAIFGGAGAAGLLGSRPRKKAPGRQDRRSEKTCPAEIGPPEQRGENHENAAAAKNFLDRDYTNRNHAYRQDMGPKPDRPAPYLALFDPKKRRPDPAVYKVNITRFT